LNAEIVMRLSNKSGGRNGKAPSGCNGEAVMKPANPFGRNTDMNHVNTDRYDLVRAPAKSTYRRHLCPLIEALMSAANAQNFRPIQAGIKRHKEPPAG